MTVPLKAPFPFFGGKSKVAPLVWARLGNPRNYIEPFMGSLAMLLKRPGVGAIETVNDLDCYLVNFWRSVHADPVKVAEFADFPVNETQLHAVHKWLVRSDEAVEFIERVRTDHRYYNAEFAGRWVQGICCWIGSGWCETQQMPHMNGGARGCIISGGVGNKKPGLYNGNTNSGPGVLSDPSKHYKRPCFPDGAGDGRGVNGRAEWKARPDIHATFGSGGLDMKDNGRPAITDAFSRGRGVNSNDYAGTCHRRREWLIDWMMRLSDRLRPVRVCCGHWSRVCDSPSTMTRLGMTGVFLDPPYRMTIDGKEGKNRAKHIYANDRHQDVNALCDEVQEWCLRWGNDKEVRIVLCGLEGEYPAIEASGWEVVAWKSNGGYGSRNADNLNAERERLWVSPHCAKVVASQGGLF